MVLPPFFCPSFGSSSQQLNLFLCNLYSVAHSIAYELVVWTRWESQTYYSIMRTVIYFQPSKWTKEGLPWPAHKEIHKSVQSLKKGKSPGIDRIRNEMIIASYPILKDVFLKLFNFIFSSRNAPEIWCKGVVSPIRKSGNKLDPDNYRPISVTSCLSNKQLEATCMILDFRCPIF